jgi:hypothetical protein
MTNRIFVNKQKLFTPKLRAFYITLGEAKHYNADDKLGSYSVSLSVDPEANADWVNQMEELGEDLYTEYLDAAGKKKLQRRDPIVPMKNEEDREGNETGNLLVKFNAKANREKDGRMWPVDVPVLDTKGNRIPTDKVKLLSRGTEMKVSFDANAYYMSGVFGISFKLRAVQVVDPVWRDGSPEDDFAGQASDGFVLDDEEAAMSDFGA